jgi:hypothetical protein
MATIVTQIHLKAKSLARLAVISEKDVMLIETEIIGISILATEVALVLVVLNY